MKATATFLASALILCSLPAATALPQAAGKAVQAAPADTQLKNKSVRIVTKDGQVLSGKVIAAEKGTLVVEIGPEKKLEIERSNVESVVVAAKAGNEAGQAVVLQQAGGAAIGRGNVAQSRPDADPEDDKERFLLLAPTGPILIEAHVTVDGKPFRMAREKLVDELLAAADTNGDGKAEWEEALASSQFRFANYGRPVPQGQQLQVAVKQYDGNQNGDVDREEVRAFLDRLGGATFQLSATPYGYNRQPDVRELIDQDKDGAISAEELAAAADRLKSRDANDDDILDAVEIRGDVYAGNRVLQQRGTGGRAAIRTSAAHLLGPAADLVSLYESMKQRYAKDGKITPENLPAAAKLLKSLDLNENGEFDAGEAIGLHLAKPQLVLEVKLFSNAGDKPEVIVKSQVKALARLGGAQAPSDSITLAGYGAELGVTGSATRQTANYKASAERMITQYDADKNGYLEKKELEGNANARYFVAQFDAWDADADGKVFAAEIEADYDRRLAPMMTRVIATGADLGVSLFSALDASGDNRLGLREMRGASKQLKRFDKDGDGRIAAEELPSRLEVAFSVGQPAYGGQYRGVVGRPGGGAGAGPAQGPKWFVHMDTNGDGDVSRREFIGPAEAFDKLDADRDGLLSRAEAEKG